MSTPNPGSTSALRTQHCPVCTEYPGVGAFCSECGVLTSHPTSGDYAAPYQLRLGAELLDLVIFLLLPVWLVWMWSSSRDCQSPAKSLLNLYVISESGQPITPQRMWVRELVIKRLLLGLVGYAFSLLGPIINAGWILMNPDRQCVHDRFVGTLVVVRRDAPKLATERSTFAQSEVRMPPPAPPGPRVAPTLPPTPSARPDQSASESEHSGSPRPARNVPTSPELKALERERTTLSQAEYERRRQSLLKELEDSA